MVLARSLNVFIAGDKLRMDLPMRKTVVCAVGTRPEAIKMASLIKAFQATSSARCVVLLTGQHRELAAAGLRGRGDRGGFRSGCDQAGIAV